MSFEQSTPINLQLSNNSLEISNSQISKNQTPLSPSNQTTPQKFFQNDQDLIFLNFSFYSFFKVLKFKFSNIK